MPAISPLLSSMLALAKGHRDSILVHIAAGSVVQITATDLETTVTATRKGAGTLPQVDYSAPCDAPATALLPCAPIRGAKVDLLSTPVSLAGGYVPEVPTVYDETTPPPYTGAPRKVLTPGTHAKCPKLALPGGATLATDDPTCYPPAPEIIPSDSVADADGIPWATIQGAVGYAIPKDDNRYGLNGLHLETGAGDCLRACATDGSRLALYDTSTRLRGTLPRHMLVPRSTVILVARLFGDTPTSTTWYPRAVVITGTVDGWTVRVHARLIDGEFPAYRSVMPGKDHGVITVNRAHLVAALTALLPYAGDGCVTGAVHDGQWYLHARNAADQTERHLSIPVAVTLNRKTRTAEKGADPVPYIIPVQGWNLAYLRDGVANMAGDVVTLGVQIELSPTVVRDPSDPARYAIVMPVRTDIPTSPESIATMAHGDAFPAPAVKPARKPAVKAKGTAPAPAAPAPVADPELATLRATLAEVRAERDALRSQVDAGLKEIHALKNHAAMDRDVIKGLRADLETARNAPPCPAVTVDKVTSDAFGMAGLPGVTVAEPAPATPVQGTAPSNVVPLPVNVAPCTRAEDAPAALSAARRALASGDRGALESALAGLPTWSSKKVDALRQSLTAALTVAA